MPVRRFAPYIDRWDTRLLRLHQRPVAAQLVLGLEKVAAIRP
jgi:hypothetical protein